MGGGSNCIKEPADFPKDGNDAYQTLLSPEYIGDIIMNCRRSSLLESRWTRLTVRPGKGKWQGGDLLRSFKYNNSTLVLSFFLFKCN